MDSMIRGLFITFCMDSIEHTELIKRLLLILTTFPQTVHFGALKPGPGLISMSADKIKLNVAEVLA